MSAIPIAAMSVSASNPGNAPPVSTVMVCDAGS